MSTQKKTIKVFMFLLPALITLLGYAAFHDMLFKERPCLINCDTQSPYSDNEKLKKWLAFLESLRDNPFATDPTRKGSSPTALDLAFLQNKFANKGDYFQRYKQMISDLTNPTVVKEVNEERKSPIHVAQLSDPSTTSDTNAQTFVIDQVPEDIKDPLFIVGSPNDQRYPPKTPYFEKDQPLGPHKPIEEPKDPGPPGPPPPPYEPGNGGPFNPISNVPVPKAVYLLLGLALAIVTIRFKLSHRTH
ncbi:hypothetical protein [Methylotenera sp. 1P/1]|uniref:hypothetical protein n=1 Tax=Methylotenera sp. 1P/1 TaxID=1131551 RepID=UPI000382A1A8|nr:hypothetical protein [Methylotenera sp. 1P/1]